MKNRTYIRFLAGVLCLCMLFSACNQQKGDSTQPTTQTPPENTQSTTVPLDIPVVHTVRIQTEGGMALEKVGVYVYTDASMTELVWFDRTDADGKMSFTDVPSDSYVAVLNGVPEEYAVEEQYLLTGVDTSIVLTPKESEEQALANLRYDLGSIMQDFTVVDTEGVEHTLSQLLQSRKAVVLNFFYNECAPCRPEFPHLQEAYGQYSDQIALIGMNPVNQDPETIEALKQELGLSFPMSACDPDWAKAMQLTGYPTTVVIDRYGMIVLKHMGSVPDAKTFKDTFAFFTADDYVQTVVEDISTLVTDEPDNPVDISGQSKVQLTIRPGETLSYDVYKLNDMVMTVKGEGARVTYKDKTYDSKDGTLSLNVSCPDNYTPVHIDFTNTGTQTTTYEVSFSAKAGSWDNPYSLKLGEFTTKIYSGNEKGVNYRYTAKEDGILKFTCLNVSDSVEYSYVIYNLTSYVYLTSEYDSQTSEDGKLVISVKVKKGDSIRVAISTLPDENNHYPGATFLTLAEFLQGDGEEDQEEEIKAVYSLSVTDSNATPVPGVAIKVTGENFSEVWTTDDNGVAQKELLAGEYTATVTVPAGYTCETATFLLTQEVLSAQTVLVPVVITDAQYSVTVLDPEGVPVENVMVIIGDVFGTTGSDGKVIAELTVSDYAVNVSNLPAYLIAPQSSFTFTEGSFELTVMLAYKPGSEYAPISVESMPFDTLMLKPEEGLHYILPLQEDMLLTIHDSDAYIIYNGVTYGAVNGVLSVCIETTELAEVVVGNSGDSEEVYTVKLLSSIGTKDNPQVITSVEQLEAIFESGQTEFYYSWTAPSGGTVEFTLESLLENVRGELIVFNSVTGEQVVIGTDNEVPEETVPEETVPEETVPEETVPEETVPEETVPEETVPEETVPEETVPEETVPEETVPEETVPEETVPEETVPDETVPEETVPEETVPEETVPEETVPEETVPEETVPEETVPEETVPEETVPEETVPKETVPEETVPEETVPEETVPEETVPEETVPEETVPEETVPEETVPEETVPEETVPEETVPDETVPEETVPEETVPEETVPEETVPDETVPDETVPDEPGTEVPAPKPIKVSAGDQVILCVRVKLPEGAEETEVRFQIKGIFVSDGENLPESPDEPEEEKTAVYTVTVTDYAQVPAAELMVAVYDAEGALVTTAVTDDNGMASFNLPRADYSVKLLGTERFYEKSTAVFTAGKNQLLILLAEEPSDENIDFVFACDGEYAYAVGEGGTHVTPGAGQMGYSTEHGVTFYVFVPKRAGIYRFTTSNPNAEIGFWNVPSFIYNITDSLDDYADNAFTRTVQEANLGVAYVLGVSSDTQCALEITWLGEPGFDPDYVPYTSYVGSYVPESFGYTGGALTDVDVLHGEADDYVLVYNETDGYYHLGKEDGPVMYARLSGAGAKVSLDLMINGDGVAGGAAFRATFYDQYGKLYKEDYSALMIQYISAMKQGTTVYPLTQDLYYMLSKGVVFHGWITPGNGNYLFGEDQINQDIGWMLLLCYEE